MHLTLKKEATKPPAKNFLQQQAKFDDFIHQFNYERPHQALDMKYPAELYSPSPRPYMGLSEVEYPFHDCTVTVTQCGRICIGRRKNQLERRVCWPGCRNHGSQRQNLAGQLYEIRPRLLRSRDRAGRMRRKPLRC
jgi:hypothetical protein